MRHHPRNSPAAAARLVALALIADGHVCRSELAALRHAGAETSLGLAPGELGAVLQGLCEDLLLAQHAGPMGARLDEALVAALATDVDDPCLQAAVLQAVDAATRADGHLLAAERVVAESLARAWRMPVPLPMAA